MAVEVWANDASATVTSGGTNAPAAGTVQTLTLSGSTFPAVSSSASPPTVAYAADPAAPSEVFEITNISGSTATVTRGADGTTPVTHAAGFTLNQVIAGATLRGLQVIVPATSDTSGTADTAAINAVMQAGQLAVLQPGALYYVGNLKPDSYGGIIGNGATVQAVAGTTGYVISLLHPATTKQVVVRDLIVNCNQVCGGVQLDNTGFAPISAFVPYDPLHSFANVFVVAAAGDAWHLDNNARGLSFHNCKQYFASGYGWYLGPGAGASGAGCTDSNFTGCVSGISGNHGVYISAGSSNNMLTAFKVFWAGFTESSSGGGTGSWTSATACGIEVQGDWNKIVGSDCQQNALHGIDLQSCDSNTVTGNNCDSNSANASTGVGINVNAGTNCAVVGNVGSNNSGLSPAAQTYGYAVGGACTGSLFYANSVYGTSGGFLYVAGGYGFQILDQSTCGLWSAAIAQFPSPTWSTYGTTQALSNNSTIVNGVPSTGGNFATYPVSSTANVTGLVLAAPPNGAGTMALVSNTTAYTLTFAASGTSNVAGGTSDVIAGGAVAVYIYDGTASLWRRVNGSLTGQGPVTLSAGSVTAAPLNLTSGTLETTASAGAVEYDGTCFYATAQASSRQVVDAEQLITLTSTYTLTSQTAVQKIFNASTNGALTVEGSTTYFFECFFTLSSMSSSSGAFGFALGGTATLTSQMWESEGNKATLATAASPQNTVNTAANTAIVTATTATVGWARCWGKIRVNAAGTLIPQVSLGVAAAAIVGADSYFRIWPAGTSSVTNVGDWS